MIIESCLLEKSTVIKAVIKESTMYICSVQYLYLHHVLMFLRCMMKVQCVLMWSSSTAVAMTPLITVLIVSTPSPVSASG